MAMTYATISGRITQPGTNVGIRARVIATPLTVNSTLSFEDDPRLSIGPQAALTDSAGNLATLNIPTNVDLPELYWTITAESLDKVPGVPAKWTIKDVVEITASAELRDLAEVDTLTVNPDLLVSLTDLVNDAEDARDDAESAALDASTSATAAAGSQSAAASSATAAAGSATAAAGSASAASTSASTATTQAGIATTKAAEATGSASDAAASAGAASGAAASTDSTMAGRIADGASLTAAAVIAAIDARVPQATTSAQGKVELATTGETTTGTDTDRAVTAAGVKAAIDARTASSTAAGIVELATDAETTTGTDTARATTPANVKAAIDARTASTTAQGIVELATNAETTTGTDTVRAVTPAGLKAQFDATQTISGEKTYTSRMTGLAFHRKGQKRVSLLASGVDADNTGVNSIFSPLGTALGLAGTDSEIYYPPGTYLQGAGPYLGSNHFKAGMVIRGAGPGLTTIKCPAGSTGIMFELLANGITLKDLTLDLTPASGTGGNFAARLNNVVGTQVENLEVIGSGGVAGTRAIYLLGTVTDTVIRNLSGYNLTWGLLTDSAAVVDGVRLLDFVLDGNGVLGDAVQFNVPTGSWKNVEVGHGQAKNFTSSGSNYGMGVGFAGPGQGAKIHHVRFKSLGLDGVHFESEGAASKDIWVTDSDFESCVRSAVSLQPETVSAVNGSYEGVTIRDNKARTCLTGLPSGKTAGVFEVASLFTSATAKAVDMRGNQAFDCGTTGEDSVGALFYSGVSKSRMIDTTVVRQVGTRSAGSIEAVDSGTGNTVAGTLAY